MKSMPVRMPEERHHELRVRSLVEGRSMNELVNLAIQRYLDDTAGDPELVAVVARAQEQYKEALTELAER